MSTKIGCPGCGQKYLLEGNALGKVIGCQKCGRKFKLVTTKEPPKVNALLPPAAKSFSMNRGKEPENRNGQTQKGESNVIGHPVEKNNEHSSPDAGNSAKKISGFTLLYAALGLAFLLLCVALTGRFIAGTGDPVETVAQTRQPVVRSASNAQDSAIGPSKKEAVEKDFSSETDAKFEKLNKELEKLRTELDRKTDELPDVVAKSEQAVVQITNGNVFGSGFVFRKSGSVLTNYHVVEGGENVFVRFKDGKTVQSQGVLAYDKRRDLAILKVSVGKDLTYLDLSYSIPQKGESVVAIGSPKGLGYSASRGIVSAVRQGENTRSTLPGARLIQIDAAINPGNSGGPVIGRDGKVIGITSFKLSGAEGLNFAVSSLDAINLISQIQVDANGNELVASFETLPRVVKKRSRAEIAEERANAALMAEAKRRESERVEREKQKRLLAQKALEAEKEIAEKNREAAIKQAEFDRVLSEIQSSRDLLKRVLDQIEIVQNSRLQALAQAKKLESQASFWRNEIDKGNARLRRINDVLVIRTLNNDDGTMYRPGRTEPKTNVQLRVERGTIQNLQNRATMLINELRQEYNSLDAKARLELGQLNNLTQQKNQLQNRIAELESIN